MAVKETTREREARFRAERFAALRATPLYVEALAATANEPHDSEFMAGERLTLKAGHRKITADEGEVWQLALADSLKARGYTVISHGLTFGLYAGRDTIRYRVTVAGDER